MPPFASSCSANPFSPGAATPLPKGHNQVHTPPNEQTPLSGPAQPSAVPNDFSSVVMMMTQTLQAVQAQIQALTQLVTVMNQQQQQSLQQQPQLQATAPLTPSVPGAQNETKADSAGKLDLKWLPAMPFPAWKAWKDRITEIHEHGVWLGSFHQLGERVAQLFWTRNPRGCYKRSYGESFDA